MRFWKSYLGFRKNHFVDAKNVNDGSNRTAMAAAMYVQIALKPHVVYALSGSSQDRRVDWLFTTFHSKLLSKRLAKKKKKNTRPE